jgi:Uncharacterized protein predicted to be involved in DNA repair
MIKRTLCFSNPAYLSLRNEQLVIKMPDEGQDETSCENGKNEILRTIPIEDIGVVVLDNKQITLTQGVLEKMLENNCAVITCDSSHLPVGLMLPLCGNTTQKSDSVTRSMPRCPCKNNCGNKPCNAKSAIRRLY